MNKSCYLTFNFNQNNFIKLKLFEVCVFEKKNINDTQLYVHSPTT